MEVQDLRISKLREYLFGIIDTMINSDKYQINANFLSNDIDNYSLDKIPTNTEVQKWIISIIRKRDVYSFRSRMAYSPDTIENLKNIGFFEEFESIISYNNKNGILPNIKGIESIECLNSGTMNNAESNTAEFNIQIQITFRDDLEREVASL